MSSCTRSGGLIQPGDPPPARPLSNDSQPIINTKRTAKSAPRVSLPTPSHFVHAEEVYADLREKLIKPLTVEQQTAYQRLQTTFGSNSKQPPNSQVYIDAVGDLDILLFNRNLRGNVKVTWNVLPTKHGVGTNGICSKFFLRRAHIKLNKLLYLTGSKEQILGTLLHELLHAYTAIMMGPVWRALMVWKADHGPQFEQTIGAIVERLGLEGLRVEHVDSAE